MADDAGSNAGFVPPTTPGGFVDWAEEGPAPARTSIAVPVAYLRAWQEDFDAHIAKVKAMTPEQRAQYDKETERLREASGGHG